MTIERKSFYEAVTAYNQPITQFETHDQAEKWMDWNDEVDAMPGASVNFVTITTEREPIRRRKLRVVSSSQGR